MFQALPTPENPRDKEEATLVRLANPAKVRTLYRTWVASHERRGGDRRVPVSLGYFKGLSVEYTRARGLATLDLIGGSVSVEVSGLPVETISDLWLVDNRPGPGRSTRPEPGDGMLYIGSLTGDGSMATLEAAVAEGTFEHFVVDTVVIARSGEDPVEGPVLFGSPSTFQRLYSRARLQQRRGSADNPNLSQASSSLDTLLGISPAHAAGSIVVDPDVLFDPLVAEGARLYFNEQFQGNGRTCATCHPAVNNFTIDPEFISKLRDDDALFVAEFTPALSQNFEKPTLMRSRGLILENLDGFDDLENKFTMRGVPHLLGLATSVDGPNIPFDNTFNPDFGIFPPGQRTGWSGDGAPGAGTLRDFTTGAVIQHFPRTLNRAPGADFRLPTDGELDALEAFLLSLGRSQEINISDLTAPDFLTFTDPVVERGKEIFNTLDTEGGTVPAGKCALCHENAGANINAGFFGALIPGLAGGNANFGTGVNDLPSLPADLIDPANNPRDGGFARVAHDGFNCLPPRGGFGTVTPEGGILPPGLCEEDFNTPPLVEAADSGPFFHNNAVDTLEAAVSFYNDPEFNQSSGGQVAAALDTGGIGIVLSSTEVTAVANMLRVVNALENIRSSIDLDQAALGRGRSTAHRLLEVSRAELRDAVQVLDSAGLHPEAVGELRAAIALNREARGALFRVIRDIIIREGIETKEAARALMVN
jgi:cytochrome c peroxidase